MAYKVYKLTSPSQKIYIGITCQPIKMRWMNGKGYKQCPAVNKAIKKYGWDAFKKEVLYDDLTETEAKELEISLIKQYKSNDKKIGYNLTEGGDGTRGRHLSEEARQHLREVNLGRVITEEQREKIRRSLLGRHHSEETKRKMSESRRGNKYNLGKKHTEEWKRKISEGQRGANNQRARKVICLETLKVYDTIKQAKDETGATKIVQCCSSRYTNVRSNGLHWKYYDESVSLEEYRALLKTI